MPFSAGDCGDCGGILWRAVPGTKPGKPEGDIVLEVSTDGQAWVKVPMAFGALQAEFYYQNENLLYPPNRGYRGGEMYMDALRDAVSFGWEHVRDRIAFDRAAKRAA